MRSIVHVVLISLVVTHAAAAAALLRQEGHSSMDISSAGHLVKEHLVKHQEMLSDPESSCPTGQTEEYVIETEAGTGGVATNGNWCEETCADEAESEDSGGAGAARGSCSSQGYTLLKTGADPDIIQTPPPDYPPLAIHFFNGTGKDPTAEELAAPVDSDKLEFDCPIDPPHGPTTGYKMVKDKDCQQMCVRDDEPEMQKFMLARTGVTKGLCEEDHLGDYLGASVTVKVFVKDPNNVTATAAAPSPPVQNKPP